MKKLISIISAMALTAGMAASLSANAIEVATGDYPEVYFKASEAKGAEILSGGAVYINTKADGAKDASISSELYLKDPKPLAGWITLRWAADKAGVSLKNLSGPVAKYGKTPYSDVPSDSKITDVFKTSDGRTLFSVDYSLLATTEETYRPLALSGEKSDSYPLACFDVTIDSDADLGSYNVNVCDSAPYYSSVVLREHSTLTSKSFSIDNKLLKTTPLLVNVSDRLLGDVDGNGKVNAGDATAMLQAYANVSTGKGIGLSPAEAAAADVDGNGKINSVDASHALSYYAYQSLPSSDKNKSLNDFIING